MGEGRDPGTRLELSDRIAKVLALDPSAPALEFHGVWHSWGELGSTADEQKKTVLRLREELERAAGQAVTEALDELEAQTLERRRAIEEITERLRAREKAVADSIEKAETDLRARLDVALVEWERRQTDRLERVTEREVERHAQVAMLALDERFREAREEAAAHRGDDRTKVGRGAWARSRAVFRWRGKGRFVCA